jgi:hypothetical protein
VLGINTIDSGALFGCGDVVRLCSPQVEEKTLIWSKHNTSKNSLSEKRQAADQSSMVSTKFSLQFIENFRQYLVMLFEKTPGFPPRGVFGLSGTA